MKKSGNCKISEELRAQIVARYNAGDSMASISKGLNVPYHSVRYAVSAAEHRGEEQLPACPSCFKDFNEAAITAMACKNMGFDSESTGVICRTKGCSVQSLKDIAVWFSRNASIQTNSSMRALSAEVSELKEQVKLANKRLEEAQELNKKDTEALANFAKRVLLLEKSESELLAEKSLLKKVLAGFSQKL